jgi:hypothetical protein
MRPRTTIPRVIIRFRLRSLLVLIAFLGLLSAVILQTVRLERAASREARLRAELRTAVDQMFTLVAERTAAGTPTAQPRGELLEGALKFYEGMESNASSAQARTRALERVRQIRSKLGDETEEEKSKPLSRAVPRRSEP